jgi:hypothetical protein
LSAGDSAVRESANGAFIHFASATQDRAGSPAWTGYSAADRDFLMRLVAMHGLRGTARVLRTLADEIKAFAIEAKHQRGMRSKQAP